MIKHLLFAIALTLSVGATAQDQKVYEHPQYGPEYIEGEVAMYELIDANKRWPKEAVKAHIKGKVYVRFVVTTLGKIDGVQIENGLGFGLNEEAIRLVQLTDGMWKPGFHEGKAVNCLIIMPVRFY